MLLYTKSKDKTNWRLWIDKMWYDYIKLEKEFITVNIIRNFVWIVSILIYFNLKAIYLLFLENMTLKYIEYRYMNKVYYLLVLIYIVFLNCIKLAHAILNVIFEMNLLMCTSG